MFRTMEKLELKIWV